MSKQKIDISTGRSNDRKIIVRVKRVPNYRPAPLPVGQLKIFTDSLFFALKVHAANPGGFQERIEHLYVTARDMGIAPNPLIQGFFVAMKGHLENGSAFQKRFGGLYVKLRESVARGRGDDPSEAKKHARKDLRSLRAAV